MIENSLPRVGAGGVFQKLAKNDRLRNNVVKLLNFKLTIYKKFFRVVEHKWDRARYNTSVQYRLNVNKNHSIVSRPVCTIM